MGGGGQAELVGSFPQLEVKIDLTVVLAFPATQSDIDAIEVGFQAGSNLLFDASDGRVSIRNVRITNKQSDYDNADIIIYPVTGNAGAFGRIGDRNGVGIVMYRSDLSAFTVAHELGHYAIGLLDEYAGNTIEDDCSTGGGPPYGRCIDLDQVDESNNCIMDGTEGVQTFDALSNRCLLNPTGFASTESAASTITICAGRRARWNARTWQASFAMRPEPS